MGGYQYGDGLYGGGLTGSRPGPNPAMFTAGGTLLSTLGGAAPPPWPMAAARRIGAICCHDIGAGQEICTLAKVAFKMWSGINGCIDTILDGRAVNDARGLENPCVRQDNPWRIVTCCRGEGCVEPTNFCLWNDKGHSWGNHFLGMRMAREWM